jgi:hypothetical protein
VLVREVKACSDSSKERKFESKIMCGRNSRVGVALVALSFRSYVVVYRVGVALVALSFRP